MVTTHPIQYQVPWLRLLARQPGVDLHVYFAMIPDAVEQGREFGVAFEWDVPLLEGYSYTVLDNRAKRPSLTEFGGCDTPDIANELRRGEYDAVIVNGWGTKMALQALWACRTSGTPCVVRGEVNGLRPRAAWKRWLHARLLSQYAACLSIGTNNRRYLREAGVPEQRIFHTPYCVDNARFADAADAFRHAPGRQALQERFGLEPDRVTYLFSGKFVEKKRPGDIVEAVRRLPEQECEQMQVLMVGEGPLGEALRASSESVPIRYTGFLNQSEIASAYAAADCLVLPSNHGETWGLVVNEAMACGLPALVSDQVGCAVDLVTPGETGGIFGCGDIGALAEWLARLSRSPELLIEMGTKARRRVHSDYNFQRVLDGVLESLESVRRKPV